MPHSAAVAQWGTPRAGQELLMVDLDEIELAAEVDCRGLLCPLPVLETGKALDQLHGGAVVLVICTDPAAVIDLEVYCATSGHPLLGSRRHGDQLHFWIRK